MKALIRLSAIVVGLVVVLVVGAFAYLKLAFDPNDFRDRLGAEVRKATGRDLVIDGDLDLSLFPWLGVRIGAARLGNAPGFPARDFARIRAAQVRALLMPMLSGRIEVDRVVIDGLEVDLEVDPQGVGNWADLASLGKGGSDTDPAREPGVSGGPGPRGAPALVLGGLTLSDATLRWQDHSGGTEFVLEGLDLETGRLAPGEALPVRLAARLQSQRPALSARIGLASTARWDPGGRRHRLEDLRLDVDAQGAALPGAAAKLALRSDVELDPVAGSAQIQGFRLDTYGLELSGDLAASALDSAPRLTGRLSLAEFDPRRLAAALGVALPAAADESALRRMAMEGSIDATASRIRLDKVEMRLDGSRVEGQVAVEEFAGPRVAFELAVDELDVDRYLPADRVAPARHPADKAAGAHRGATQAALIPPGLTIDGALRLGRLKLGGVHLADLRLPLTVQSGRARLAPTASLYEGRYRGDIGVDGRQGEPTVTLAEKLEGVKVAPLTRDLTGREARVSGTANVTLTLRFRGADADAIQRTLDGEARLDFADGALQGVNLAAMMRQAEALLTGQPAPPDSGPNETDFTDLGATIRFENGVASNDDLIMRSPLLRVQGQGRAKLAEQSLDYLIRASVVGTLTGQGGKPLTRVKSVTVPIRVSGSFSEPMYALDVKGLLEDKVGQTLDEKKEEVRKKAGEKLKQELQKGLRGLLR